MSESVKVNLSLFAAGACQHPEALTIRGGTLRPVPFPAGFACIRHPQEGYILFDTGYSSRFFRETSRFPSSLYRWITPVSFREEDHALRQLQRSGIKAEEIRCVILSHFHADHIGGVRDFPHATFIYKQEAYEAVRKLGAFASVRAGYLPGLLPADFEDRSRFIEACGIRTLPPEAPFPSAYDLLGDGSLLAVDIPGHAAGQIGLWLRTERHPYFLCADAVWSSRAFRERRKPHWAAGLIMADRARYMDTFERLCRLHREFPELRIVPSHCREALGLALQEEHEVGAL